jgi:hypothetical protein
MPTRVQLATELLYKNVTGHDLDVVVSSRRKQGASWRTIAAEINATSQDGVWVTHQTLVNWYGEQIAA